MDECVPVINTGLRGVEVASSRICDVRGEEGKLIYRGFPIEELAGNATFEEVCFLLLYERLPGKEELDAFDRRLKEKRHVPDNVFSFLKLLPSDAGTMDVLQAGVPLLAQNDKGVQDEDSRIETAMASAESLISGIAVITAAWERIRNGRDVVRPDEELSHAANFLYMMKGEKADAETVHFFDTSLILHAEHSFNASTFTARQVGSTRAHIYAAAAAAIGSLSGSLHGGANVRVMAMLKEIGSVDNIDAFVDRKLSAGDRIMGLGHAVYQTDDPRAMILAPMSKRMGEIAGETLWYELSRELERRARAAFRKRKERDIYSNVDFYSASLFYAMGIPADLFTPVFAVSRMAGWTAHVIEEQFARAAPKPTIYRPGAAYVGNYCGPDTCSFVDITDR